MNTADEFETTEKNEISSDNEIEATQQNKTTSDNEVETTEKSEISSDDDIKEEKAKKTLSKRMNIYSHQPKNLKRNSSENVTKQDINKFSEAQFIFCLWQRQLLYWL
jgi:hypothetical protein